MKDIDALIERLDGTVCYASTNKEWPNVILQEAAQALRQLQARVVEEAEKAHAALEEAAKWHEEQAEQIDEQKRQGNIFVSSQEANKHMRYAAAIRNLKR